MQKRAFTMIELIFVIIILGILAAVAVPKLAATRNDAIVSAELGSAAQVLKNLGSQWAAKESWTGYGITEANNAVRCFVLTSTNEGNVTITPLTNPSDKCPSGVLTEVKSLAAKNGILESNEGAKTYQFGGISIKLY